MEYIQGYNSATLYYEYIIIGMGTPIPMLDFCNYFGTISTWSSIVISPCCLFFQSVNINKQLKDNLRSTGTKRFYSFDLSDGSICRKYKGIIITGQTIKNINYH